ncbi:tRNA dihydrouridine(20/20a) synthase DusA [Enterobacteriaceae endosymbiont of Macroplea mutica]|uniref:tRNA dihydrouridine(20/20a) synthase DusA n=1 Tax=Enterobacteriaceae endosymbiont of Macroplea mutica TaxID=2675791 RepID=UPI001449A1C1|nr:tRNA dihydrouridine(20/20a) synthase DusA [Enterobacteriaceae endosymbiont of Macroplea mutica]QJC31082.1 tRNA dihydrouridine(20/20a) synthase DusA [Enterobacteriaceae endosymbiont of Macroplea mutica]
MKYFRFEIAPMLHRTNKYCRYFYRLLTQKALLYTEMIHCHAIIHNQDILLTNYHDDNLVLQLAGNNSKILALCAIKAEKIGYKEINFNVGCPSLQSQRNNFGACLMNHLHIVTDCIKAMSDSVNIPVTIKTRIGINDANSYDFLCELIYQLSHHGCKRFILHARKALLYNNLTTKKNLTIPLLDYPIIYKIKKKFPSINITLNGGIKNLLEAKKHLQYVDGVMLGRSILHNPRILMHVDQALFSMQKPIQNPISVIESMFPYIEKMLNNGIAFYSIITPILNFFHGMEGAKIFKQYLTNKNNYITYNSIQVLNKALSFIK